MPSKSNRNQWFVLAGLILLCLAAGSLGGFANASSIDTLVPHAGQAQLEPA